jgi:hypothetical protein
MCSTAAGGRAAERRVLPRETMEAIVKGPEGQREEQVCGVGAKEQCKKGAASDHKQEERENLGIMSLAFTQGFLSICYLGNIAHHRQMPLTLHLLRHRLLASHCTWNVLQLCTSLFTACDIRYGAFIPTFQMNNPRSEKSRDDPNSSLSTKAKPRPRAFNKIPWCVERLWRFARG